MPRLPALLQVLHRRSRRCSSSSTATTTRTPAKLTTAEQDQVVDECFQCKLCYVNCPYTPGQHEWALDFPRLMLRADAMRHATKDVPAGRRRTDNLMGRTDLIGEARVAPGPAP